MDYSKNSYRTMIRINLARIEGTRHEGSVAVYNTMFARRKEHLVVVKVDFKTLGTIQLAVFCVTSGQSTQDWVL
jgi:hypothetical protein